MKILICLILSFASFGSFANAAPMLKAFAPISTTVTHVGGSVVNVGTNYVGRNAANSAVYAFRNVSVPKASFYSVLKSRAGSVLFNPWLAAGLLAADLIFNDGDIETHVLVDSNVAPDGSYFYAKYFNALATGSSTPTGACANAFATVNSVTGAVDVYTMNSFGTYGTCVIERHYENGTIGGLASSSILITTGNVGDGQPFYESSPASDSALDDFISTLSPSQLRDLWKNPETNNYDDVQPMADAGADLTSDYNAENDSDPLTDPTVDPAAGDTGNDSVGDVPPEEEQELLCDKFPEIIACQELDESPQDPIPVVGSEELASTFTAENLSSSATCPADGSASVQGQSISFSYQPVCDLATAISPLFIALCSIVGIYILVGAVRD
jgi:hypothetical protein